MDIVHIEVIFEDQFSFAKEKKIVTRSQATFEKMKAGVGSTYSVFDEKSQIHRDLKVISVTQAS